MKILSYLISVKNAPVNYAIRFSGPVTALTARRVRYGRRTRPHLPSPVLSPGIKTHSSPAAFPATLSLPFVPSLFTFLHRPLWSCLRPHRAPLLPAAPSSPQKRYDAASGKNAAARLAGSYSLDALGSTASSNNLGTSNVVASQLLWHHNFVGNLGISNVVTSQLLWLVVFALYVICLVVTRVPLPAHESSLSQFNTTILTTRL